MSKIYIYRCSNDSATIYYNKEYPDSKGIPIFEYDGDIPEGPGILKTDGKTLYREAIKPISEPEPPEPTTEEILDTLLGVTDNE